MDKHEWITTEMFYDKLVEIIDRHPASVLLSIAGVYDLLSEEFNNQILEELENEREETSDE